MSTVVTLQEAQQNAALSHHRALWDHADVLVSFASLYNIHNMVVDTSPAVLRATTEPQEDAESSLDGFSIGWDSYAGHQ